MATKYGTAREIADTKKELDALRSIESDPYRFGSIQDKSEFRKRKTALERRVAAITPPPVSSDVERRILMDRRDKLEEFVKNQSSAGMTVKPAMPSKHDMWENPSGAVGRHRSWEDKIKNWTLDTKGNMVKAKAGYGAHSELKDIYSRLTPMEEQMMDPDSRSLENLRSQSASGQSLIDRRSMNFAQGAAVTQEQWDEAFGEEEKPKRKERRPALPEEQCNEMKKDGTKCTGRKVPGKEYCLGHSRKHSEAVAV